MTKLSGTSGQVFSGLAETLNMRGASRSTKGAGAKSHADSSFNDLLHTVSNMAKRALSDEASDNAVKAGTLVTRLVHPAAKDASKDDPVLERAMAANKPTSPEKVSDEKTEKSLEKKSPVDRTEKTDVQNRSSMPAIVGEIVAAPVAAPQAQVPAADKKDTSGRAERSPTTKREVPAASAAKPTTTDSSSPTVAAAVAPRSQAAASQAAATALATSMQDSEAPPTAMPATPGFEAITANVERAAKASTRDALPEAIKVTVVQQETHLPPAQFNAPQQVANAVVAELKESSAPTASAAPDLAASQTNAPDQPLKILTINLEPPALGNVSVRLRLVGTEVSVQLAAERKDTSRMLDQQRDSIRELMQSAGYVADVAPVQHGSLDGFQSGSGQSQPQASGQQQPSSQSQGTFDGASNSSGQSDDGAKQARHGRQSNQETRHDQDVAPQNRRGPVYL